MTCPKSLLSGDSPHQDPLLKGIFKSYNHCLKAVSGQIRKGLNTPNLPQYHKHIPETC